MTLANNGLWRISKRHFFDLYEEALARELAADFYAQRKRHHLVCNYLKEGKKQITNKFIVALRDGECVLNILRSLMEKT